MKRMEWIKLWFRAQKYKYKNDRGGIAYLHDALKEGQTVVDIGAHKGGYLYFMQKLVGSQGKVYGFEPQTSLFGYISRVKALFNWENVTLERIALSDCSGTGTLGIPKSHLSKGSSPGATMARERMDHNFIFTEQVAMESLDAYCLRRGIAPDFLKIDVEGNELRVFQGGMELLRHKKPRILVEIEARHVGKERVEETFAFLKSLGYVGYFIRGDKRFPLANFSFEQHQNTANMRKYCNNFVFEAG
jgi:FkbM family methyltransferase